MDKTMKSPQRINVELDPDEVAALDRMRAESLRTRPMELKFLLAQEVARRDAVKTEGVA